MKGEAAAGTSGARPRVLLVEDDLVDQLAFKRAVRDLGSPSHGRCPAPWGRAAVGSDRLGLRPWPAAGRRPARGRGACDLGLTRLSALGDNRPS